MLPGGLFGMTVILNRDEPPFCWDGKLGVDTMYKTVVG